MALPSTGSMVGTGSWVQGGLSLTLEEQCPVGTVVGKHKEDRNMDPEPAEDALSTVIRNIKSAFGENNLLPGQVT